MASNKILDVKKEVVSEIKDKVSDSASVIFFDYRGLSVAETTELRNKLRQSNSDIKIYKNTMVKRALDSLNLNVGNVLEGPNAISLSKDVIEPIKVLTNYAKDHTALSIKGGIIDGNVSSIEELAKLATIPSREGLLTMLAGGMIGIAKDLSICLQLYSEQKTE
jgi:large subunit ribosomal protein L10